MGLSRSTLSLVTEAKRLHKSAVEAADKAEAAGADAIIGKFSVVVGYRRGFFVLRVPMRDDQVKEAHAENSERLKRLFADHKKYGDDPDHAGAVMTDECAKQLKAFVADLDDFVARILGPLESMGFRAKPG